jgi:hypothetical protein
VALNHAIECEVAHTWVSFVTAEEIGRSSRLREERRRGRLRRSDREIVLGTVSIIAEARWLVRLSAALTVLAALLTVNGFFFVVELPLA